MHKLAGLIALTLALTACATSSAPPEPSGGGPDLQSIRDAYVYLLGRALVVRQEQADLAEEGVDYNVIKYNPVGQADFVNPNLDVAYLEAWIAVDAETPVVLTVPRVQDRYYTAQLLDEWGEVIANLNERTYPQHPHGEFALVAPGSTAPVPEGAERVELHSNKAKLLARVELKGDEAGAVALQQQFTLRPLGTPRVAPIVPVPRFENKDLLGAELFFHTKALLDSAPDVSPVADELRATTEAVAAYAGVPANREQLEQTIRADVVPHFLRYAVTESGKFQNNWLGTLGTGNYGANYWIRTSANLVGIWANNNDEVVYYVATRDAQGQPLNGAHDYTLRFAPGDPDAVVDAYWSVILVDVPNYRVVPNELDRFNFNDQSPLERSPDGSLEITISAQRRPDAPPANWLPSPAKRGFSLTFRTYVPKARVKQGDWFPPAIERQD